MRHMRKASAISRVQQSVEQPRKQPEDQTEEAKERKNQNRKQRIKKKQKKKRRDRKKKLHRKPPAATVTPMTTRETKDWKEKVTGMVRASNGVKKN